MSWQLSDARDGIFGVVLITLGGVVAITTATGVSNASVAGPQLFPYLISIGLVLTGISFIRHAFNRADRSEIVEVNWKPVGIIYLGLWVQFVVLIFFGWVPAAALLFIAIAFAFGSRRIVLNAALGLALAAILFVGFNYGLGLQLPIGSLVETFTQ
jgi:putative tricarboxylic transport membrane protein